MNLLNNLTAKFSKEIKSFGITEVFIYMGEVYITSNYDLPSELIAEIESTIL